MAFITSSIKWITDIVGDYWFPTPALTGSQQLTVLRDTEYQTWINFEVTGCDRMEVDYEPQRGVKRLLDDDDEIWSISRKQPMSPESKRIRLCADSRPRPFVSKRNRKEKQMRKFRRRRRVSISVSASVIPVQPEPVDHSTSFCLPLEYAVMPVIQPTLIMPSMMPSVNEQSNDVLVESDVVPKNRKPNNQRNDRTKNKVGAIYTAKGGDRKGIRHH